MLGKVLQSDGSYASAANPFRDDGDAGIHSAENELDAAIQAQSEVDNTGQSTDDILIQGSRQHIMMQNERSPSPDSSRSVSPDDGPRNSSPIASARRGPVSATGYKPPPRAVPTASLYPPPAYNAYFDQTGSRKIWTKFSGEPNF